MNTLLRAGVVVAALNLAVAPLARASGEASPFLPVAAWKTTPISLEDLKGQVVVLVFYSDSKA